MTPAVVQLLIYFRDLLAPPPRLRISEWADEFRFLSSESSAQTGKYRSALTPYCREIMDEANNREVQRVVVMMASQLGKTETLNNVVGYFIDQDPAPILVVQPTVEFAESWSKERLDPMIRDTPRLSGCVADSKSRSANNTIRMKSFPGGNIAIVGANAPSGLAGRPRRVVLLDEVDRFPLSAGDEGDPCSLAVKRTASFWNSVVVMTSTPTVRGASRIEAEFEKTDKRKWHVPCPACGAFQELKWAQVKWPKRGDEHVTEQAFYECEKCAKQWNDTERVAAVKYGKWVSTAPFTGKRGYHLNGIACTFPPQSGFKSRLHQMAQEFLDAKRGGPETLKTWTNTFLAETFEEIGERLDAMPLMERQEDYTPDTIPNGAIVLLASVDVQGDRVELQVSALGEGEEIWAVQYAKIFGDPEKDEVWKDLAGQLSRKFRRADGCELPITATTIDLGHKPARVRRFIKECGLPRVFGVFGINSGKQHALVVPRQNKHYRMFSYSINGTSAKDMLFARLKITDAGARYIHFPKDCGFDDYYFSGLTAEESRIRYTHGFPERYYEKIKERNEPIDLFVYLFACVDILKPNLKAIAAGLTPGKVVSESVSYVLKPVEPQVPPAFAPKPRPSAPRRGSWVGVSKW